MSRVQSKDNHYKDFKVLEDRVARLERVSSQLLLKDVNTTGLNDAQIDAAVFGGSTGGQASDGLVISDKTNNLILVRENATWNRFLPTNSVAPARAHQGSAQSLSAIYQFLLIDTVDFDPGNHFDLPNNRYVVPTTGFYLVSAEVLLTSSDSALYMSIQVNGALARDGSLAPGQGGVLTDVFRCNAGDAIKVAFQIAAPNSLSINPTRNYLTVSRIV